MTKLHDDFLLAHAVIETRLVAFWRDRVEAEPQRGGGFAIEPTHYGVTLSYQDADRDWIQIEYPVAAFDEDFGAACAALREFRVEEQRREQARQEQLRATETSREREQYERLRAKYGGMP